MQIKGTGIRTNIEYFKLNYAQYYASFLEKLDSDLLRVYKDGDYSLAEWYEIKKYYLEPMTLFADIVGIKDKDAFARDIGRYSAQTTLTGVYKVFLLVSSPLYIMKKASRLMKTFYKDAESEVIDENKNWCRLRIFYFPDINSMLEHRIAGYGEKAIEMSNANPLYRVEKSLAKGDKETVIYYEWK